LTLRFSCGQRERAADILTIIEEVLQPLFAADTKGELNLLRGRGMLHAGRGYPRLRSIFRETRYAGLSL